jgi:nicotinamide riboside kinase
MKNEQKSHEKARGLLFCDTEPIVLKIWAQYKYGRVDAEILEVCRNAAYNHYLLMNIDLPWEHDPQREHPHEREFFFNWFKRELDTAGASYSIVGGKENERLKTATTVIDSLLISLSHKK